MKKVSKSLVDVIFIISLALLGKYDMTCFKLPIYQLIASVFWASGVIYLMNNEGKLKTVLVDAIKNVLVAISIIPLWFWVSGEKGFDLFEPLSILIHLSALAAVYFGGIWPRKKDFGKIVYYTCAAIPIIIFVLINCGVPIAYSVICAVIMAELVGFLFYQKKGKRMKKQLRKCDAEYLKQKKQQYREVALAVQQVISSCGYEENKGSFTLAKEWILNNEKRSVGEMAKNVICDYLRDITRWIPIVISFVIGSLSQALLNGPEGLFNVGFWLCVGMVTILGFSIEVALKAMSERSGKLCIRILNALTYEEYEVLMKDNIGDEIGNEGKESN